MIRTALHRVTLTAVSWFAWEAPAFAAPPPRFFPLDPGNEWTYVEEGRPAAEEFVVKVTGIEDGVTTVDFGGFATARIKDRQAELDIEIGGEGFLTYYRFYEDSFVHRDINGCNDNRKLVVVSRDEKVETPAGTFTGCLRLEYSGGHCADAGGESEWWALEVGRVKFVEQSIMGPRTHVLRSVLHGGGGEPSFQRGDSDADGTAVLTDAVFTLNYLFIGGAEPSCQDAADTNDDGAVDIGDPISLLGYLFLGSAPPPAPGPGKCGVDPTADDLATCSAPSCGEAK